MSSEATLVATFVDLLRSGETPWGEVGIVQEFFYARGKTDVVITTDNSTIAIEAKLIDWRKALDQAYRNTCFAEESYILMPEPKANFALKFMNEFEVRGVGICCIVGGQIKILFTPNPSPPLEPWITAQARSLASV
ncbi:hypothetical protein [Edaphobacter flagellatus]|uniref:hypothetical protein n=1 Tax=Edaphobacter flagellatus TaxID=1933044 RepID=UPI0021B390BD|nr:hypothetical protein [Edaphobacter flagellatus]